MRVSNGKKSDSSAGAVVVDASEPRVLCGACTAREEVRRGAGATQMHRICGSERKGAVAWLKAALAPPSRHT